ncbi:MAG TPA: hypothetical protein VFV03_00265 [Solirubrobacteraceae bacterium]|nr:hypothetical protein [Solirubrobacteraceae bacterium]
MADESLFQGGTLRDRFVAAVSRDDETIAQRLDPLLPGPTDLHAQRDEAWRLLSAGGVWAARALSSVGIDGTDERPIGDSDAAFERAQHLDRQLWKLSQQTGFNDAVALLVESVKQACYHAADLGPQIGGLISTARAPGAPVPVTREREPDPTDLQALGGNLGTALRRLSEQDLADAVREANAFLSQTTA